VREELPEATEAIKWGSPAFVHPRGTILLVHQRPQGARELHRHPEREGGLRRGARGARDRQGQREAPYDTPMPEDLLRRMARHRLAEFEQDGVNWM
jgi:Uncharacterized conserved protein